MSVIDIQYAEPLRLHREIVVSYPACVQFPVTGGQAWQEAPKVAMMTPQIYIQPGDLLDVHATIEITNTRQQDFTVVGRLGLAQNSDDTQISPPPLWVEIGSGGGGPVHPSNHAVVHRHARYLHDPAASAISRRVNLTIKCVSSNPGGWGVWQGADCSLVVRVLRP